MKRRNRLMIAAGLLATALLPFAPLNALAEQRPTPPDLPPTKLARQSIDQDPAVVEARRALSAAGHGAAALRAGSHEWTTKLAAQRRRYDNGGNSSEWTASLERTIRIGGKAGIDAQLGDNELVIGQARIGEARHEAARALADLWLDTLATSRQRELWAEQLSFAETSHQAVEKRRKAGDASMLDLNVAKADLIEVQRQLGAAVSAEGKAKAKLAVRFPTLNGLTSPVPPALQRLRPWTPARPLVRRPRCPMSPHNDCRSHLSPYSNPNSDRYAVERGAPTKIPSQAPASIHGPNGIAVSAEICY